MLRTDSGITQYTLLSNVDVMNGLMQHVVTWLCYLFRLHMHLAPCCFVFCCFLLRIVIIIFVIGGQR